MKRHAFEFVLSLVKCNFLIRFTFYSHLIYIIDTCVRELYASGCHYHTSLPDIWLHGVIACWKLRDSDVKVYALITNIFSYD